MKINILKYLDKCQNKGLFLESDIASHRDFQNRWDKIAIGSYGAK